VHAGGIGQDAVGVEHDRVQAIQEEGRRTAARLGHTGILSPARLRQDRPASSGRIRFIADSGMGPMPPPGRDLRLYGDGLDRAILRGAMRNCSLGGEVR
jgi:hypothetical protein